MRALRPLFSFVLLLTVLLALAPSTGRVLAQAEATDPENGRLLYDGAFDAPRLPGLAHAAQAEPLAPALGDYGGTTRLAFQSARNEHDWEVFIAAGNGANQYNKSEHSGADIYPRLRPGAAQVAFASNRDGNYAIWVSDLYWSYMAVIPGQTGNNVYPAWSPDGSRIAFQSDRDGQAEIYVMDANGGNVRRLTAYADYDGEPQWSPDGLHIVFTRRTAGQYRVWVMDADGANVRQLSQQPNSEHPIWSPDGQWIAYDADGNGDGWQEVWLMDATGGNQRSVFTPGEPDTDALANSWSPDGRYIAFTRVSWIFYQGEWYWTTAFVDAYPIWEGGATMRLIAAGADWFADWQARDLEPPTSSVLPLPAYSRAGRLTVQWQGRDTGKSGIYAYNLATRRETGLWNEWMEWTAETSTVLTLTAGQTLAFRVRASDKAGNVEAWPAGDVADASTSIYASLLSGKLTDNRGIPLPRTPITILPAPWNSVQTVFDGSFLAYLVATGDHTVTIDRPGYASLALSGIPAEQDRRLDAYLPPQGNQVANGTFETSATLPAQWTVTGPEGTAALSADAHLGARALQLGRDCPALCPDLREPLDLSLGTSHVDTATDSLGNLYVVSAGPDGNRVVPRFTVRSPDGVWSPPETLGATGLNDARSGVAVDGHDTIHVAWSAPDGLYYRSRSRGGAWSAPQRFAQNANNLDIEADALGGVHIVYNTWNPLGGNSRVEYVERLPSGAWLPAIVLDGPKAGSGPAVAIGPDNSVHFLYSDTEYGNERVLYRWRPYGGALLSAEEVLPGVYLNLPPGFAVGNDGTVHVAFYRGLPPASGSVYLQKPAGGTWSVPERVGDSGAPALALGADGAVYFAGLKGYGPYELFFRTRMPDGSWLEPRLLGESYTEAYALAAGRTDVVHLVSVRGQRLHHWMTRVAPEEFTVTVSQSIVIPADLHRPTLAVNYASTGQALPLSIRIDAGMTTTEVFSKTAAATWQLASADLSAWAGRQVTVTFAMTQPAGLPYGQIRLDDITVGEWTTPVIQGIAPARVDVQTGAHIVLRGANFMDKPSVKIGPVELPDVVWVDEHTIEATLPPVLPVGIYDVWVTNPGGAANMLGQAFHSGWPVYLPRINR